MVHRSACAAVDLLEKAIPGQFPVDSCLKSPRMRKAPATARETQATAGDEQAPTAATPASRCWGHAGRSCALGLVPFFSAHPFLFSFTADARFPSQIQQKSLDLGQLTHHGVTFVCRAADACGCRRRRCL